MIESVEDLDALTEEQLTTVSEILYALFPECRTASLYLNKDDLNY